MKKIISLIILCGMLRVEAQTSTFFKVDSLLSIGRYKKALLLLNNEESSFLANKKKATIYDVLDNHKKATFYYKEALVFKDDYQTNVRLGKSLKKSGKKKEAIFVFEQIIKKDLGNLLVKYELGKLYLQTKQILKAKKVFEELIKKDIGNANYSYQLASVYTLLKKRNLKINTLLEVHKKDTTHLMAIVKLAKEYVKLRDKDSTKLFVEKGLQLNSERLDLNRMKINRLYSNKEYEKAVVLLNYIDSLAPNEHYTQKMLGRCYYKLKELDNAEKYFKLATEIDGEDYNGYTYLGDVYFEKNKIKSAMFSYRMASYVGKEPRDKAYLGLAKVYTEMKLPKRTLEQYRKAVAENHKNFQALFLLAKFSEDYYKDKKIAYNLYEKYISSFEGKFKENDEFVKYRIKKIKKDYFLKGEILDVK